MEKTLQTAQTAQDENAIPKRSKVGANNSNAIAAARPQRRASVSKATAAASTSHISRPVLSNVTNTATAIHTTTASTTSIPNASKIQTRSKTKREGSGTENQHSTALLTATATTTHTSSTTTATAQRLALKRSATETSSHLDERTDFKRSKTDYEWQDLDADDKDDPLMVCEYVNDIFDYLSELEEKTLPDSKYLEWQAGLKPKMRSILVDWIVEVHLRFRLLPETLFLAINIMDRFMSKETVQVEKLQLLATGSLFIAAKYEEVYSPSVKNYSYVTDGGYTEEDILNAERYILQVLGFDLSYPNPMNFLRRISKADDYDIETRTVGKYLLEISIMDHRFIGIKPSLCAAAAMFVSRRMLGRSPWNGTLIHYSGGYTKSDIRPVVHLLMQYLTEPVCHEEFFKKYASKRYMKSSILARHWAKQLVQEGTDVMDD